jgi:hypothetical protein
LSSPEISFVELCFPLGELIVFTIFEVTLLIEVLALSYLFIAVYGLLPKDYGERAFGSELE